VPGGATSDAGERQEIFGAGTGAATFECPMGDEVPPRRRPRAMPYRRCTPLLLATSVARK
jgi:hypothetical protein